MPAALYTVFRSQVVQNWVSQRVASWLSEELNTEVSVGGVNMTFFLDLVLEDIHIRDHHHNTLLYAGYLRAGVDEIDLEKRRIILNRLSLDHAFVALMRYYGEKSLNYQFIIGHFKSEKDSSPAASPWTFSINHIKLNCVRLVYNDHNARHPEEGMDYGKIDVDEIYMAASDFEVSRDTIRAKVHQLRAREKCGLILGSMRTDLEVNKHALIFRNTAVRTASSEMDLDLAFRFETWKDFSSFEEKVILETSIRQAVINGSDLGYFAPELKEFDECFTISAEASGRVDSLVSEQLSVVYGYHTLLNGSATLRGLPDLNNTYITADISNLSTHSSDLAAMKMPDGKGSVSLIAVPAEINKLGMIRMGGRFEGYFHDFNARVWLQCDLGRLDADLFMKGDYGRAPNTYSGHVRSEGFNIGALTDPSGRVGNIALDAEITGSGFAMETANVRLDGQVFLFEFNKYPYRNLGVNGTLARRIFNGELKARDPNLNMDFGGYVDFRDSIPVYDFTANLFLARLNRINLVESDSITDVQANITAHFMGTNVDNITGSITIENALYKDGGKDYRLEHFRLTALPGLYGSRSFFVKSDYVDAEFHGTFFFEDMELSVKQFIASHLPGITFKNDSLNKATRRQDFNFEIIFYNADPVLKYFIDDISVSPNTYLKGRFDSRDMDLRLDLSSEELIWRNTEFRNVYAHARSENRSIFINSGSSRLMLTDTAHIDQIVLDATINNDSLNYRLTWDNGPEGPRYASDIGGFVLFENGKTILGMRPSWFAIHDTTWNIHLGGNVSIDSTGATIPGIYIVSNKQGMEIKGRVSKDSAERIRVAFTKMNLNDFDYLTEKMGFDLDGIMEGYVDIWGILEKPVYSAKVNIARLAFNSSILGNARIMASWDQRDQGIRINSDVIYVGREGEMSPVKIEGLYYPDNKENALALNLYITNFNLRSLSRYLDGIAEIREGFASGSFTLTGPLSDPELIGKVQLMRTRFRVDYLNTVYSTAHKEIRVDKHGFYFDQLEILDQPYNNKAVCNGRITHTRFRDWNFDLEVYPQNLLCLNTSYSQNELFYGTAHASGYVHLTGNEKNLDVKLDIKTERGTQLFIPMDFSAEISENDFIIFTGSDSIGVRKVAENDLEGITMQGQFQVTDDAEVQILFDPSVGDRIRGRGNGNITMEITSDGRFLMTGDYTVKSGDYLFTFENVLNKRFVIEEGGTIRWTGDPYEADLNLKAIYRLKTSLNSLGYETQQGTVPVNCEISMSGLLTNPLFSFGVDLPGMRDVEKNMYLDIINQNLNYNFLTLLIVNSFYNPGVTAGGSGSSAVSNASMLGTIPSEVLSNQMSNWLSQISRKVDIGLNYRPGDQITQQEVEVALSTQLFNEVLKIEGNVGMGGANVNSPSKNSSNIVGDVNVEVRLSENTRLHVFNKSNQQDYLLNDVPYTQGVGVFYRKEFNTFKELFQRKKKKEKKEKNNKSKQ